MKIVQFCLYDLIGGVKLVETVIVLGLFEYFNIDQVRVLAALNTCQICESALRIPHTCDHWWVDNLIVSQLQVPMRIIDSRKLDGCIVVAVDCVESHIDFRFLFFNSLIFQLLALVFLVYSSS